MKSKSEQLSIIFPVSWEELEEKKTMIIYEKNYPTKEKVVIRFKCNRCGGKKFIRKKTQYHLTWLEGNFRCLKCKEEYNYADDVWLEDTKENLEG